MATIKVKGLEQLRKSVNSKLKVAINKTLRDKSLRKFVGETIRDDIRKNFKGIPQQSTVKYRTYLEQFNSTHPDYSKGKINITFSGELLEDLAKNVKADTTKLMLIVEHSDKKHRLYKVGNKRKRKGARKKSSYSEISQGIQDHGYDYLQISDQASKLITNDIKETLFKYLSEALN